MNEEPLREDLNTPPPAETELPDASVEQTDPIAKLEAELSEQKEKWYRLAAEFENYKKRVTKERQDLAKMAGADMLLAILPALDDLERALKSGGDSAGNEGVQLIYNKMKASLEAKGLKAMDALGQPFDVEIHEAIVQAPAPDEQSKGKVLDVITKGYFLHDRVLRYAQVVVAI